MLFRAGGPGKVRNEMRGVREKFSGAFANSPLTGFPFILRTLPLAAIELAHGEVFWHDVYDLALHVLPDPTEKVCPLETVSQHNQIHLYNQCIINIISELGGSGKWDLGLEMKAFR